MPTGDANAVVGHFSYRWLLELEFAPHRLRKLTFRLKPVFSDTAVVGVPAPPARIRAWAVTPTRRGLGKPPFGALLAGLQT